MLTMKPLTKPLTKLMWWANSPPFGALVIGVDDQKMVMYLDNRI